MPPRHKVDHLEPEVRDMFEGLLKRPRGVDEFTELANGVLEELGSEERLSRSSAYRFMIGFEEERKAMRETQHITAAFARELGEIPDSDNARVMVEMLRALMLKVIRPGLRGEGEALDPQDIMLLARSLRDTMATMKGSVDMEIKLRDRLAKELAAKLDQAVGEAEAAGEAGLSKERLKQAIEGFLGVRPGAGK